MTKSQTKAEEIQMHSYLLLVRLLLRLRFLLPRLLLLLLRSLVFSLSRLSPFLPLLSLPLLLSRSESSSLRVDAPLADVEGGEEGDDEDTALEDCACGTMFTRSGCT